MPLGRLAGMAGQLSEAGRGVDEKPKAALTSIKASPAPVDVRSKRPDTKLAARFCIAAPKSRHRR
jgi:hypothetical protein